MGLSITKLLVEKMEGAIWVTHCSAKAQPFYYAAGAAGLTAARSPRHPAIATRWPLPLLLDAVPKSADLAILLVGNPINQKVALRTFEYLGYGIDLAQNGVEAVAAAQKRAYDIIFMDIQMPEMDGLEATRQIRHLTGQPADQQIIAMTAAVLENERRQALTAGMNDLIAKPIHPEKIAQKLLDLQPTFSQATVIA
ncbi:MAG: response regulator [Caldilineaceae bacterium]